MPPIDQHQSAQYTKLLLVGDSGSGKTGALASLAAAGYKLRILDLDNGLDILKGYLTNPLSHYVQKRPDCASLVDFRTITERMKVVGNQIFPASATVWPRAVSMLTQWKYKDDQGEEIDLGRPQDWGPDTVLCIDSLSMLATAALNFHLSMNAALQMARSQNEGRRDIGTTQNMLRKVLELIFDASLRCNVVMTSHITFVSETGDRPAEGGGAAQGYPSAIGRALSPHIPRYFNTVLVARTIGSGTSAKHRLFTIGQNVGGQLINAKSSDPLRVKPDYDLGTGLAEYFQAVRTHTPLAQAAPPIKASAQPQPQP